VIEVDGAGAGHAVLRSQENLGGDVPDRRGDGCDGDFAEVVQHRVPGEQEDGTLLVGTAESVPADLPSLHHSAQTCSLSQSLISPGSTGWRS
jgi:hypothetical protein